MKNVFDTKGKFYSRPYMYIEMNGTTFEHNVGIILKPSNLQQRRFDLPSAVYLCSCWRFLGSHCSFKKVPNNRT